VWSDFTQHSKLNTIHYELYIGFGVINIKLYDILNGVSCTLTQGKDDIDINNITIDSRKAVQCSLFVCIEGMTVDGHSYIGSAYGNGCRAVIAEKEVDGIPKDMTVIRVESSRAVLNTMAANFYSHPAEGMDIIGVTGTNGKTSTTYFMESVLARAGRRTGIIGTVEIRIAGERCDIPFATSTTPDTLELNAILREMADRAADTVVMEVSSHALELKKVDGTHFKVGIFTNLTQDHLDFHKTMENYCRSKAKLFALCDHGVVNIDDEWADKIISEAKCDITTFGIEKKADVRAYDIEYLPDRVRFKADVCGDTASFELNVPGRFSVYNALGVIAAAYRLGIGLDDIVAGIADIKGVPGRIQSVPNSRGFNVIVDYAHTPDGLDKIIRSVREFTKGRVITVFGCGGDRDKTKRPIMGEIAARLGDIAILTSDNPRSEEPCDILKDIEAGVKPVGKTYEMYVDRKEAIFRAVAIAEKGDSVIIAGKGHENYEIFKDKTIHFDDVEVAEEALGEQEK
jgi:UDP-N-acetylmuramoyl-L-alanyl-D-glutamate--2,6-diaminopimelate ligase